MKAKIINQIIEKTDSQSYLEIGFGDGSNFRKVVCKDKVSVDPMGAPCCKMTSDEFFKDNEEDFDAIFIDGDHRAEEVRKDITNALRCNPKVIICHDTIPKDKAMQEVPQKQRVYTGDAWRALVGFIENYPDVLVETHIADYGLTCIYPEGKRVRKHFENTEMTYEEFEGNKVELLNII